MQSTDLINWQTIDTVLLDLDGTLLDLQFDNHFWQEFLPKVHAQHKGISLTEAKHQLYQHYKKIEGSIQWYCLDYWDEVLNLDLQRLKEQLQHRICLRPQALTFLRTLAKSRMRVILATNAHPKGLNLKLATTNISQYFDAIYNAHQLGHPKEEQEFWQRLFNHENIKANQCLFIDDNEQVLESAAKFGIAQLLHVSQPDTSVPPRQNSNYPLLNNFNQLQPNLDSLNRSKTT